LSEKKSVQENGNPLGNVNNNVEKQNKKEDIKGIDETKNDCKINQNIKLDSENSKDITTEEDK